MIGSTATHASFSQKPGYRRSLRGPVGVTCMKKEDGSNSEFVRRVRSIRDRSKERRKEYSKTVHKTLRDLGNTERKLIQQWIVDFSTLFDPIEETSSSKGDSLDDLVEADEIIDVDSKES